MNTDPAISGIGYERVTSNASCVITRFRVRSVFGMFRAWRAYRRVRKASASVPGLRAALFATDGFHVFYTISVWDRDTAVLEFNCLQSHVKAANMCFRDLDVSDGKRVLWSGHFRLIATSGFNVQWR